MHVFVWVEIYFLWVPWMVIAPNVFPKTSGEFTTAVKLSAICKRPGLRFPEVKYILKRKKSKSVSVLSISQAQLREASGFSREGRSL